MATIHVDQAKLVLNAFAAHFENNLVSKDLVTWNKFTGEMNDRNGLTVVEQVAPRYNVTRNYESVADLTAGPQNSLFGSEQYKATDVYGTSLGYGDFQKIQDFNSARESEALKMAGINLAETVDSVILGYMTNASNNWLGDGTSAISDYDDFAGAYTRVKEEGVTGDEELRAVLSYGDKQALGNAIVTSAGPLDGIGSDVYKNAFGLSVAGIPTLFTQQLPTVVCGSRVATGASLTNGVTATTYDLVSISGAPGQYLTQQINIDGQSGAVTLKEGETFTIAGVYAYDNRAKKRLNHLQQFRVVGGTGSDGNNAGVYTAAAGAFTNVRIFPAIITSGAYQTVDVTGTLDNLAITHKGAANDVLQPRVIAKKSAVIVNTMDLPTPFTGESARVNLAKIPLSVRMWKDSVWGNGEHRIRFDVCVTPNIRANGRQEIVRVNGS